MSRTNAWQIWLTAILPLVLAMPAAGQSFYRYQAETGTLSGVFINNAVAGYSGTGYVTGFDNGTDKVTVQATVPAGLYELWVRYNSPYGHKGYTYQVGAERGDGSFDGTASPNPYQLDRAGVFKLSSATTPLAIIKNWGYYDVDYFELRPTTVAPPSPVPTTLSDPLADARTQYLMDYLVANYGSKTLAAQQSNIGVNGVWPSANYLSKSGGLVPAIRGSDFIEYSPSRVAHGSTPAGESERVINWAKQTGGVVSMMWHWNAPTDLIDTPGHEWWRGFYTDSTTFDVEDVLAHPGSSKYNLLVSDIDAIATQLQKYEDAGVPVLWRPLHEAQGGWFWWGAKGAEPFKELWNLMYDRLTNVHGLHNLIWVYTSSAGDQDFQNWYPGDDVVDIVGADVYTDASSAMSGQWLDLLDEYDGRKMVTLSETGTLPIPSAFDEREIRWSWFMPWDIDGPDLGVTTHYTAAQIQAVLGHDDVITLNELPVTPWSILATANADFSGDGAIDGADLLKWQQTMWDFGGPADANGDGFIDGSDLAVWKYQVGLLLAAQAAQAAPEPAALALATLAAIVVVGCRK
jgi:mannan endo-1,4-beta-mannosidase